IARVQLGRGAAVIASLAILFIVIIALAGLGFVVVKALGGEEVKLPKGMVIIVPAGAEPVMSDVIREGDTHSTFTFPAGCKVRYSPDQPESVRPESFRVKYPNEAIVEEMRRTITPERMRE